MKIGTIKYIRSERARRYLTDHRADGSCINGTNFYSQERVVNVVKMAEEDMRDQTRQDVRERAVKARIASCPYLYPNGSCAGSNAGCIGKGCPQIESFLIHYDNEA